MLIHTLTRAALDFSGALGSGALVAVDLLAPPPALGSPLAFNNTEVSHDSFICQYAFWVESQLASYIKHVCIF